MERFGPLHIVFANAGITGVWAPIEQLQPEERECREKGQGQQGREQDVTPLCPSRGDDPMTPPEREERTRKDELCQT